MQNRIWVLAVNDGEAVEIVRLLQEHGEQVLRSRQPWGESWAGLEEEIQAALCQFRNANPLGEIVGIELSGENAYGACNIDHHRYDSDDRSCPLSSLEQVAARIGAQLSRRQQLVAANDRGFIPAMQEMGATKDEICDVRDQDLGAQGVTAEQIAAERLEIDSASVRGGRYIVKSVFDTPTAHADILFLEKRATEWLICGPKVWSYSGPRHAQMVALHLEEHHWSGGRQESGYFGVQQPGARSQQLILAFFES
jgi:hypothetical protein